MKKRWIIKVLALTTIVFNACSDYLDVVPEGVATINMAFNQRDEAIKYLYTCYSYMPRNGNPGSDPAILGSDELCTYNTPNSTFPGFDLSAVKLAHGMQNTASPLLDMWGRLYQGIRDCNIFLENVGLVPDLPEWERDQWIAEVKFLKAYYHFYLVQMYGPVPIVKVNLPIDVNVFDVKVSRDPVDSCFNYIVELLDEAAQGGLSLKVQDPAKELGRITIPIALSLKAKVLITAASPLFNGNNDQATLQNIDGTQLFNSTNDLSKWNKAVVACKEAIAVCEEAGMELYYYPTSALTNLTDTIITQMSLRNAFCERWESEIIWANTQSLSTEIQQYSAPKLNPAFRDAPGIRSIIGVPLKIAKLFYTHHGVPISEDKTRIPNDIYSLRTGNIDEKLYVKSGTTTVDMHFDREPRFYAYLGFDGGIWYGAGKTDDSKELWYVAAKKGETDGQVAPSVGTLTGYFCKKFVHYNNTLTSLLSYSITTYPWPIIRLSDLYLMYAEAINEAEGNSGANQAEMFKYIDLVRARAGLESVKESWDKYTNNPKYSSQAGMRKIIQLERMIELAFEGQRFWDLRRWKTAPELYKEPIESWNLGQYKAADYYSPLVLYTQTFGVKDYFWPIRNSDIINNRNLVQNIGW